MRHGYFGKQLSRTKNERRILFRNLARELILHGKIITTKAKAKAVQPIVEKLITKAKSGTDEKKREIYSVLTDSSIVQMLASDAKHRFVNRSSGFTRIIKLGPRRGDGAEEVILSFIDERPLSGEIVTEKKKEKKEDIKGTKTTEKKNVEKTKAMKKS